MEKIRQPIVTVAGHVDHGKTSILDCFRGSSVQEGEAGGITQKISFTKYPMTQIKKACPLIDKSNVKLDIPGFLFIDTPGHAAFTNLRKRGGSLADLAILVVAAKEGIKPQTAEVLKILKENKTPFLVAWNKIDNISGWQKRGNLKEKVEAILYDGSLKEGDEIVVASLSGKPIVSKVRALEEIEPLSFKYKNVKSVLAATGVRLHLTEKEGIVSGMPFQKLEGNLKEIAKEIEKEIETTVELDKQGIIVKADSLGSLEALLTLLRQSGVKIVRAGIGNIGKVDVVNAKANLEIDALDAVIVGFNVSVEEGLEVSGVKVFTDEVVYKLIENLAKWREGKRAEIERERMLGLAAICKLEILHKYVFRNSNPAILNNLIRENLH